MVGGCRSGRAGSCPAGRLLLALVIGSWDWEASEQCLEGTSPTKKPMVLPVNPVQSPIPTASANAVNMGGPTQAAQPVRHRDELGVRGHERDRLIEPVSGR